MMSGRFALYLFLLERISHVLCEDSIPLAVMDIISELNSVSTGKGKEIIEGDIAVPSQTEDNGLEGRKGIVNVLSLWIGGQVSYNFHSSVSAETKDKIRQAIQHWEEKTCLKFHERLFDISYLRFRTDTSGCWSFIGRSNSLFSGQDVSIGPGCNQVDIIVHEIGHAIGFYHEQSRLDRQGYITILWNNIRNGMSGQFETGMDSSRGVKYDFMSIMHYGSMAFSRRMFEKNTIVTKNPHFQRYIGTRRGLTFRDTKTANMMYLCNAGCPNSTMINCENGGYLGPHRGNDEECSCVCPPDTIGEFCETVTGEYYEPPICGGNITEEGEIKTPGYPDREDGSDDSCSWWIQAPPNHRVRVQFMDFSFRPRMESSSKSLKNKCVYERVEIRSENPDDGNMYCGEDFPKGTTVISRSREFIIIIISSAKSRKVGRGLHAKVSFVEIRSIIPWNFSI